MHVPVGQSRLRANCDDVVDSLLEIIADLDGVAHAQELAEMVLVRDGALAVIPSAAAYDLVSEPMTPAEETAARLLCAIAFHARDAGLSDREITRLVSAATVYVARLETYIVERTTN